MSKTVIIQASSRSNGDTGSIVKHIQSYTNYDIIDLKTKDIGHYDYNYQNQHDDFPGLMAFIISHYDTIIFATPVYWYSMSGILKVFFDRISDLLRIDKDLGRKLRGKNMAMISISNHDDIMPGFSMPFKESAKYLGMHYLGDIHASIENNEISDQVKLRLLNFIKGLNTKCQ
ncbi:flavodoxin family protein [Cognatitamlana onchidii]|uniref:flavodoxin family protein n=1 Tax=Cognatitamlana onchidii TaxID=2562860 RepID=UPI0010A5E59D|nr:NAD(P)H-dependent oxidoreductase [Algibacter onchidii]